MRRSCLAIFSLCVAMYLPISAQTTGFIVAEYLAPQYTASDDAPSSIVIAGKDEPGERLVVTGRTLDGRKPVAGVSLYVFHTDAEGRYAIDISDPRAAEFNPRLHGSLRTDAEGRYRYETIRPGSYGAPLGAAHVHYVVKAPGYQPLLLALQFQDDPIVVKLRKAGRPLLDPFAFKNGPCKLRRDCVLTQPVQRDAQGVSHVTRDIQMVKE
jgi:protocatechuate 3,4-dioxygenase beta subunit